MQIVGHGHNFPLLASLDDLRGCPPEDKATIILRLWATPSMSEQEEFRQLRAPDLHETEQDCLASKGCNRSGVIPVRGQIAMTICSSGYSHHERTIHASKETHNTNRGINK